MKYYNTVVINKVSLSVDCPMNSQPILVLVHEGPPLPEHAIDCVRQVRLFHPDTPIYFLLDSSNMDRSQMLFPRTLNVHFVDMDKDVPRHTLSNLFTYRARHLCQTFRDGFWYWTTKRFATLLRFAAHRRLTNVFHIEYDNLVYASLPDICNSLHQMENLSRSFMAGIVDSDTQGVGSFVYFSDSDAIEHFVRFLIVSGSMYSNDMEAIAKYRLATNSEQSPESMFICLPVLPKSYCRSNVHLHSKSFLYERSGGVPYLFDGRAFGQFLDGVDRRNDPTSSSGFVNQDCAFRTNELPKIEFIEDKRGLMRPMLLGCPIANLHIHSKQLHRWTSDSDLLRQRFATQSPACQADAPTRCGHSDQ